jgi:hypothetical protein
MYLLYLIYNLLLEADSFRFASAVVLLFFRLWPLDVPLPARLSQTTQTTIASFTQSNSRA